ncbi:DUF2188 domain-containing protein [Paenibacillus favisporus]|uniref:DUF2188 domain-containing protein n=1 Tax=Paenibacillus TaxID=44249 RepID=UPI0011AB2E15|nr:MULTISPECIES: DUF2188 domain-containing protein [Paenibacillus]MEC0176324.1 DUF2188 domain-containing protein [Paenibacillus favisporus]
MPWNKHDYPVSMKNLEPRVRNKAVEIANALLEEGYEEGRAIAIGTAQAEKWNEDHPASEEGRSKHASGRSDDERDELDEHAGKTSRSHSGRGGDADVHVVTHEDGWALKVEGKDKPLSTFGSKKEAMDEAEDYASKHDVHAIVHGKDGKIESNRSYS